MAHPVQTRAEILELTPVGAYRQLLLRAPGIAGRALPGHFAALAVGGPDSSTLLRRSLSIHRADPEADTLSLVVAPDGPGSRELLRGRPGDGIDLVAPLGTAFPLPPGPLTALLVAVGHAGAPLFALADRIRQQGGSVGFILGAATADRLYGVEQAQALTPDVLVTTEDGSSGIKGRVTLPLAEALKAIGAEAVYAGGPAPVLEAVTGIANAEGARSFCAVEQPMACGVGVCMTCVLPVVGEDGVSRFVRSCVEGPCFDGSRVRWSDIGAVPADLYGAAAMGES
ncbi:dihydroorotate dehydrogenase electron transfer subunit [Streptacidiphilus sp. PB12-B1b]|uniref:iron-sulfur cluster-binding protein n=1 Tax=Streptacidiphilus sp. PB12-B1b TaxID=2705012 RepID=UPI0015FBF82D|nr:dihydroorotate dehydrogenase electron transfer subunit [Streptacidiphilus sp. PB12-B1b]QMU76080.1 dihydroorotate dehydrogenase electron transfer subunit [Streptacidiphilus sp. PB12-B1b]